MGLFRIAALSALGFVGYKLFHKYNQPVHAAFADGQPADQNFAQVRDAGRDAMRDKPADWTPLDEELDESFPASDPPANY